MAASPGPVRRANLHDLPRLVPCYEWLAAPPGRRPPRWDPAFATSALRHAIASPASTVLVLESGGEIVGFTTVYVDIESVRFGQRAWVEDLAVHPEHRSQGVGKRLLDAAKQWARERSATHLELESGEARVDAHRFYERERPSSRARSFSWEL